MPIITTQRKKQRNLIIVMGMVVFITAAVLYLGVFRGGGQGPGGVIDTAGIPGSLTIPRGFVLETSILQDVRFRQLVPYIKISRVIKTGRNNPFIPYSANIVQSVTNSTSTEE